MTDLVKMPPEANTDSAIVDTSITIKKHDISTVDSLCKELATEILHIVESRLNEAVTRGEISDDVHAQLINNFSYQVHQLEHEINTTVKLERLRELEALQRHLVKAYNQKLSEINANIDEMEGPTSINNQSEIHTNPLPHNPLFKQKNVSGRLATLFPFLRSVNSKVSVFTTMIFAGTLISTLTFIGLSFGIKTYLSIGSFLIGATFLFRILKN